MRITFIGHASLLVQAGDIRVLSDPWWRGPCFGAQWWNRPEPYIDPVQGRIDYVYISHGHHDHLHPGTLKTLDKEAKILVSSTLGLAEGIKRLGFDVVEVDPNTPFELSADLTAWVWPTHGGDTLLVLKQGDEVCINLNDALHSAPRDVQTRFLERIRQMFPQPDYVFCGYGTASHFPNCYRIPGKSDSATAAKRQSYFNGQWAHIIHELQPKFGFPFAANVVFFEQELQSLNEAVHNTERPIVRYQKLYGTPPGQLVDIAPGFQIEKRIIVEDRRFTPLRTRDLVNQYPEAVARANTYSAPSDAQVKDIAELLRRNIELCRPYLAEHSGDYRFLVCFRGSNKGLAISKTGDRIEVSEASPSSPGAETYDVAFRTRAAYLRRSLEEPYGDEMLFVGSGGVFDYRSRRLADMNLHREFQVMLRRHETCPRSRFGNNSALIFRLKQLVKALLRRSDEDLYDLRRWVVYE